MPCSARNTVALAVAIFAATTAAVSYSLFADAKAEDAPPSLKPQPETKLRPPSMAEQLVHSTVLLRAENEKGQKSTGSGFLFAFFRDGDRGVHSIVTNKVDICL